MDNNQKTAVVLVGVTLFASACAPTKSENVALVNTAETATPKQHEKCMKDNPNMSSEECWYPDTNNTSTRGDKGFFFDNRKQYVTSTSKEPGEGDVLYTGWTQDNGVLKDTTGGVFTHAATLAETNSVTLFAHYKVESGVRIAAGVLFDAARSAGSFMNGLGALWDGQAAKDGLKRDLINYVFDVKSNSFSQGGSAYSQGGSAYSSSSSNSSSTPSFTNNLGTTVDIGIKNENNNNNKNYNQQQQYQEQQQKQDQGQYQEQCQTCSSSYTPGSIPGATSTFGLQIERVVAVVDGAGRPTSISRLTVAGTNLTCS